MQPFSVLLSVYIKENPVDLEQALNSIWVDQILKPSQIVIVKDGILTEELNLVIEKFKEKAPLTIVELEKNMGLGLALNFGLKKCDYNLIARMDSDDISLPDRFLNQVNFFEKNPSIDIISGNINEFDIIPTNILTSRILPENHEKLIKYSKTRNPLNHMAVMFKKEAVINVGGYKDFWQFEDYYLWARLINKGYILHNLNTVLVNARFSSKALVRRKGVDYAISEWKFQKKLIDLNIMTKIDFIIYAPVKFLIRLMPSIFLSFIYNKLLR